MTDTERIKRITKHLNDLSCDDLSKEELYEDLENASIAEIKETMWTLICFVGDVSDVLNM